MKGFFLKLSKYTFFALFGVILLSTTLAAQTQKIYILKEIDDDNIIIVTENGDKLYLKKWSLRFSPLLFEGKYFYGHVSPMWVTIYFDDRAPIKWTVEENLGKVTPAPKSRAKPKLFGPNTATVIKNLCSIGLLQYQKTSDTYRIPFLFRPGLKLTQGKAFKRKSSR